MKASSLPYLCHPITKQPLTRHKDELLAPDGTRFPIKAGIPSLMSATSPVTHKIWAWLYNRVAFGYDFGARLGWRLSLGGAPIQRDSYLSKIQIPLNGRILETATGTATNLLALPNHAEYFGIDISFKMLRQAQRNLRKQQRQAELIHGDAQFLPLGDNLFDVTFHMGGMQFIARPDLAINEMARVTKSGGKVWVIDEAYSVARVLQRASVQKLEALVPGGSLAVNSETINQGELYCLSFTKK